MPFKGVYKTVIMRMFRYKRKATEKNIGDKYNVLWNPQGVRDFKEKSIYRTGKIVEVFEDGGFVLDLGTADMICSAWHYGRQRNPFKNLTRVAQY